MMATSTAASPCTKHVMWQVTGSSRQTQGAFQPKSAAGCLPPACHTGSHSNLLPAHKNPWLGKQRSQPTRVAPSLYSPFKQNTRSGSAISISLRGPHEEGARYGKGITMAAATARACKTAWKEETHFFTYLLPSFLPWSL